jgi:hypothetical protein
MSLRLLTEPASFINEAELTFNPDNYHFAFRGQDVTNLISRADKIRLVPDFDIDRENYRLSSELGAGGYGQDALNESVGGIFVDQMLTDPLGAPLEALDAGVKKLLDSTGVRILLIGVTIVAMVVILNKVK